MLKRIQEQCTVKSVDELNAENYTMPTLDERENPGKTWDEVVEAREKELAFRGQYKCQLCPKKVLRIERELNEHL